MHWRLEGNIKNYDQNNLIIILDVFSSIYNNVIVQLGGLLKNFQILKDYYFLIFFKYVEENS